MKEGSATSLDGKGVISIDAEWKGKSWAIESREISRAGAGGKEATRKDAFSIIWETAGSTYV